MRAFRPASICHAGSSFADLARNVFCPTATNLTTLEGRLYARTTSASTYAVRAVATNTGGDAVNALAQGVDGIGVIAASTEGAGLVVSNGTQVIPPQAGTWNYGAFLIAGSHANVRLVPGFVATFTTTFKKPGERAMPCPEYCGSGHEGMWARVQVIPADEFRARAGRGERVSCVPR